MTARRAGRGSAQDRPAFFGVSAAARGPTRAELPKGLSRETAVALVHRALSGADEPLSAAECAERVGLSRVSARRYLEHFVARGAAVVRLQYGGAGRPERRYRGDLSRCSSARVRFPLVGRVGRGGRLVP